jgi:hypothetical protein
MISKQTALWDNHPILVTSPHHNRPTPVCPNSRAPGSTANDGFEITDWLPNGSDGEREHIRMPARIVSGKPEFRLRVTLRQPAARYPVPVPAIRYPLSGTRCPLPVARRPRRTHAVEREEGAECNYYI